MKRIELNSLESWYLRQCDRPELTRRRRTVSVVSGVLFGAALTAMAVFTESWQLVLGISLLYIVIAIWERVMYANAVLVYKGLIRKLARESGLEPVDPRKEQAEIAEP